MRSLRLSLTPPSLQRSTEKWDVLAGGCLRDGGRVAASAEWRVRATARESCTAGPPNCGGQALQTPAGRLWTLVSDYVRIPAAEDGLVGMRGVPISFAAGSSVSNRRALF